MHVWLQENADPVEDVDEVSAEDTELMAGLLETIAILWEGVAHTLKKVCYSGVFLYRSLAQIRPWALKLKK